MKTTLLISLLTFLSISLSAQPGTLDKTYGENGKAYANGEKLDAHAVAIQPDGKIIEGGFGSVDSGTISGFYLTRFNTDGTVDKSFGKRGKVVTHISDRGSVLAAIGIQSSGRIVVAGTVLTDDGDANMLIRYLPNGTLDSSFGEGDSGIVIAPVQRFDDTKAIAIQADDKIVVTGTTTKGYYNYENAFVYRFTKNGKPDNTFGLKGRLVTKFNDYTEINAIALQPDGKIVIAGDHYITSTKALSIRYLTDGTQDSTFGVNGIATMGFGSSYTDCKINSIAVQTDGKLVGGGYAQKSSEPANTALVRFTNNGGEDLTFGSNGTLITSFGIYDSEAKKILLQTDGKIIAVGQYYGFTYPDDDSFFSYYALARYKVNGKLDSTFGMNGLQTTDMGPSLSCIGAVMQQDGKVIAAGDIHAYRKKNPLYYSKFALARYLTTETSKAIVSNNTQSNLIENNNLKIYPNPAKNYVTIKSAGSISKNNCFITDVSGKRITTSFTSYNTIDVSKLSAGIYFLHVMEGTKSTSIRFVKL